VGLLGTDGSTRSLQSLFAKVKSLDQQGLNSFMFTNYYGLPTITLMDSVQNDLIFIDKIGYLR
jgi:beta-aspartyl-dipeptidase (metallo-type)